MAANFQGDNMIRHIHLLVVAFATLAAVAAVHADSPREVVTERITTVLNQLEVSGDFEAASESLDRLFDQVAVHAPLNDPDTFRHVALARRMVRQMAEVKPGIRMDVLKLLRSNSRLAHAICFLVHSEHQKPDDVYSLLHKFSQVRGEWLERYATLAAAVCVVHDRPFTRRINENMTHAPDPLYIFDYFVKYESRTAFGICNMPAELLVYVVDVTASIDELLWAAERYQGDAEIGRRFFEIEYDHAHFRDGTPKKVTQAGFSLANILLHGGVCADQAYFAMTVGKAMGVPTTYTIGRSSDVSHAWVGFLQSEGRNVWWNFDAGRYEAYQGVRGIVLDPQTRQHVPDSHVALLAGLAATNEILRLQAAALVDAAVHLRGAAGRANFNPPPLVEGFSRERPRSADLDSQLALLEAALRLSSAYAPGWFAIRDMANTGELSTNHKRYWANALHRLCGDQYLDFQLAILVPMISSVEDAHAQNGLWNTAFERFSKQHDLAAEIRMHQGRMWEATGNLDRAGMCYEDVIKRYANAGHFVVDALAEAERLLRDNGRPDVVPALYENAWSYIQKPTRMAAPFARQSNWFRVGQRYAAILQSAGRAGDAATVQRQLQAD